MYKFFGYASIIVGIVAILAVSIWLALTAIVLGIIGMIIQQGTFGFEELYSKLRLGIYIGGIGLIISVLFLAFFNKYKVKAKAMTPLLKEGDYVFSAKYSYWSNSPSYGNLVLIRYPLNKCKDYILRCIGLPGDTIRIIDKQVFRNGTPLDEDQYINLPHAESLPAAMSNRDNFGPFTVPEKSYFLLADNRGRCDYDSRFIGEIEEQFIIAKPVLIPYSFEPVGEFSIDKIKQLLLSLRTDRLLQPI